MAEISQMQWPLDQGKEIFLSDLKSDLMKKNPKWTFLQEAQALVAINQNIISGNPCIADGDHVAIFPPMTGG